MDPLGQTEHMDRTHNIGFDRLHRIILVMNGRCGTGQIVNLVNFQKDRLRQIVSDQFKVRFIEQVKNVFFVAGKKIVQAQDIVTVLHQTFAQMGPQKPGAPCYQNAFIEVIFHLIPISNASWPVCRWDKR